MRDFLINNRDELIVRCQHKVAQRAARSATPLQLEHGIPLFLDQLIRTLRAENSARPDDSLRISGAAGGDAKLLSEIGVTATAHGEELLRLGFTVDQVVHDYGDLCQAVTDLAFERDAAFHVEDFRTLNRCLDNAIADAVTEFSRLRETAVIGQELAASNERLGFLVHELRNAIGTATLAVGALELSNLPLNSATGAVLKRSLAAVTSLVQHAFDTVRGNLVVERPVFGLAGFIEDAKHAAKLDARIARCEFAVDDVDPSLGIRGDRLLLQGALANLVQNAFKFTHEGTVVTLKAFAAGPHIRIEVADHCGGLPKGSAEEMFTPFRQRSADRSGLGLGLSIARQNIEAESGTLSVQDLAGIGCVFSIRLPRHAFGDTVSQ
ncbi:HAMP domain-containing sensor histidine kinase [Ramlibacter sp. PS3R-8]|uniref:sensor histidine kinase n=1 Tax=Ramlibacter sp. PS3R-8 TaxID=3133437 RepID=UPI003098C696